MLTFVHVSIKICHQFNQSINLCSYATSNPLSPSTHFPRPSSLCVFIKAPNPPILRETSMEDRGYSASPYCCPTWMVTIRGRGWRVLAPPSMAIPSVVALFPTLTSWEVGSSRPGYSRRERDTIVKENHSTSSSGKSSPAFKLPVIPTNFHL